MAKVLIIGGGPAGAVSALSLRRLGHDVELFEKEAMPRYRVGESLLPGTVSILTRLGLAEKIAAEGFVKKPSATFLWGQDQAPWTFSFSTPRSAPWIFDHAIQVERGQFDKLLLDTAKARGANVHEEHTVDDVIIEPAHVRLRVRSRDSVREVQGDFVIDGSGSGSPLVRKLKNRRYDSFYRSLAVWSYFRRKDPFAGDLKGTTYSVTFKDGWIWMIPLRNDVYSVGIIVDHSRGKDIAAKGADAFYDEMLLECPRVLEILGGAQRTENVRVVQDWSYEADHFSRDRYFLCGDAACFTDPLFSQGVHLATQSAVCAAAAIDHIERHPSEVDAVHTWYNTTYRETYEQYHEFLASFYTFASFTEPDSEFWRRRRIAESSDDRLERKQWFDRLVKKAGEDDLAIEDFRDRASTMISIGGHLRKELSDEFSDAELNGARIRWISQLTKSLNRISQLKWNGAEVVLSPTYKVNPETFTLEPKHVLGNEHGQRMTKYPLTASEREVFGRLLTQTVGYRELLQSLAETGHQERSSQIVIRMMEAGLVSGYDKNGRRVVIRDRLRFDGVGEEYEV